jgi:hypothetical protein
MVVVLMTVFVLEALHPITKIDLSANACFAHQLNCSGHRRIADTSMLLSNQIVQILNRQVSFRRQEDRRHLLPLGRLPQSLSGHKLLEFIFGIHTPYLQEPHPPASHTSKTAGWVYHTAEENRAG